MPHAVVVDTSVFADYLLYYPARPERHRRARRILDAISGLGAPVYEPFILEVELPAVLVRRLPRPRAAELAREVLEHVNIVEEAELRSDAVEIALSTGCRAVDSYYIATAGLLDAALVTSDRVQAANARKAGVEAYYLLSDADYAALAERLGAPGLGVEERYEHEEGADSPRG